MKAMIFAAGLGTRLKPLTDTLPKALVPIGGKTLLEWQIRQLQEAGITDIVVNVHHFPDQIISYLHNHANFGCHIAVSDEREALLETGGGLRFARHRLGDEEPILACNVDILSNISIPKLLAHYREEELGMLVVSERATQRYLLFDATSRLCGWTNRATEEVRPADLRIEQAARLTPLAFSGMQVLSPRIWNCLEEVAAQKGDRFSLIDAYVQLCKKEILRAYIPENYRMMDVGKIAQLQEAEAFAQSL